MAGWTFTSKCHYATVFHPKLFEAPPYSPLARAAHVEGQVTLTLTVKSDGRVASTGFLSGNPILQSAVAAGVAKWTFPMEAAGQEVHVAIEFKMNCQAANTPEHAAPLVLGLKQRSREFRLPNNTQQRASSDRIVKWNGDGYRGRLQTLLHDLMASALARGSESVPFENATDLRA